MGIMQWLGYGPALDVLAGPVNLASPWASDASVLTRVAASELLGSDVSDKLPLSRLEALQIPAVAKMRNVLVSTIAPLPLKALRGAEPLADQPTWLYRTDGQHSALTPFHRMASVVDDLLFYGHSLLACSRGASGQVTRVAHIPQDRWTITAGRVLVDEKPVDESEIVFIEAPYEGLLAIGGPTLRGARDIEKAWASRAKYPVPLTLVSETPDATRPERTEAEIAGILDYYRQRRTEDGAAVAWVPAGIEIQALGTAETDLLEKGRNAATTSIGQLGNVRASMLDGTLADSSSLTYTTALGERSAFLTFDVPFYSRVIEDRLSQDDVTPAGSRIAFDFSDLIANPQAATGAPRED